MSNVIAKYTSEEIYQQKEKDIFDTFFMIVKETENVPKDKKSSTKIFRPFIMDILGGIYKTNRNLSYVEKKIREYDEQLKEHCKIFLFGERISKRGYYEGEESFREELKTNDIILTIVYDFNRTRALKYIESACLSSLENMKLLQSCIVLIPNKVKMTEEGISLNLLKILMNTKIELTSESHKSLMDHFKDHPEDEELIIKKNNNTLSVLQ